MKTCTKCKTEKHYTEYRKDKRYADGYTTWCKACYLESSNKWRDSNRDRVRELDRNRHANRTPEQIAKDQEYERKRSLARHGLTVEEYNRILESQGNCCAICKSPEPNGKGLWHIDHDHECCDSVHSCGNCIRGLLCHSCNVAVGLFNDDVSLIEKAIRYLEKANDSKSV